MNRKDFERTADEFASRVQTELDGLTRAWDIFNNVREATGDVELAVRISGVGGEGTRNLADDLKNKIEADFKSSGVTAIPFNINFDDKDIENKVMDAFNEKAPTQNEGESDKEYAARVAKYQSKIKGIVEEYKKWRDLQRDVVKSDISEFAKLLSSAQDYETSVAKINSNLEEQKKAIDAMKKPEDMTDEEWEDTKNRAKAIADAKAESDIFKLSAQYINLMNNAAAMTGKEIEDAAKAVEQDLNKQLQVGTISAEKFASEMEKVHKIVRDSKLNSFFGSNSAWGGFAKGGVNGAVDWLDKGINKRITELGKNYTTNEKGEYNGNDKKLTDLLKSRKSWENVQNGLSSVALASEIVTGAFDGMVQATQSLAEMFDALGNESAANTWSDISDTINGISSVFKPANNLVQSAMSGNISGIISSAISAPVELFTAPITAFAALHDKKRERQIEALRRDVQQVDNTLNLIRTLRERTLGYDTGELRRNLAAQYKNSTSDSGRTMYEFYSRGGLSGNGYSQELAALKKQREDYQKMYDAEADKKKSSADALEEYKQKMSELDVTIMNYTQDLANELWGIDIAGWADQIGDALWTAFENGEDAVEAFGDTAKDIVSSVAKQMWQLSILEPLFKQLQHDLFGDYDTNTQRYKGGTVKFDSNGNIDMSASEQPTLALLGKYFGEGGIYEKAIEGGETFYDWAKKVSGIDFDSDDSSSSTSSSIKGITEQTADLLASYVNAIRADVSVNRAMIAQYFPMYYSVMTSGNNQLVALNQKAQEISISTKSIDNNTKMTFELLNGLKNKTWKVPMA